MSEDNGWRTIAMREQAKVKAMEAVVKMAKLQLRVNPMHTIHGLRDALKEVK